VMDEKEMLMGASFDVFIDAAGVGLNAKAKATLIDDDFILNPMWIFPKGGIVFPLSMGLGVSITWAGAPALMFLEMDGGLFACSLMVGGTRDEPPLLDRACLLLLTKLKKQKHDEPLLNLLCFQSQLASVQQG